MKKTHSSAIFFWIVLREIPFVAVLITFVTTLSVFCLDLLYASCGKKYGLYESPFMSSKKISDFLEKYSKIPSMLHGRTPPEMLEIVCIISIYIFLLCVFVSLAFSQRSDIRKRALEKATRPY